MELSKQEIELFLPLPSHWLKTSLTTFFPNKQRSSKLICGIIQTGNGIIFPTSRHLLHIYQGIQKLFLKQEMELSKQEMELSKQEMKLIYSHFQATDKKKSFYIIFFISTKELKIDFQNRKWNDPNRKWNYNSRFQASDQKTSFTSSSLY